MKKLIVLRGIPGCGKSTVAEDVANEYVEMGYTADICSADYFFEDENGQYKFDGSMLNQAHYQSRDDADDAMSAGINLVIIDNTNTQKREYQPYIDMANEYGYDVVIQMVGNLTDIELYASRNTHGVPKEVIERMAKRFEL